VWFDLHYPIWLDKSRRQIAPSVFNSSYHVSFIVLAYSFFYEIQCYKPGNGDLLGLVHGGNKIRT
jgi:hypothetical protein